MQTEMNDCTIEQITKAEQQLADLWHSYADCAKDDPAQSSFTVYHAVKKALAHEAEARRLIQQHR